MYMITDLTMSSNHLFIEPAPPENAHNHHSSLIEGCPLCYTLHEIKKVECNCHCHAGIPGMPDNGFNHSCVHCLPLKKVEEVKPQIQQGIIDSKEKQFIGTIFGYNLYSDQELSEEVIALINSYFKLVEQDKDSQKLTNLINSVKSKSRKLTIRECIEALTPVNGCVCRECLIERLQSLINKQ